MVTHKADQIWHTLVIREASYFAQRWTLTTSILVYDCHLGLQSCFCQIIKFDTHLAIYETILIQTQKYNFKKNWGAVPVVVRLMHDIQHDII